MLAGRTGQGLGHPRSDNPRVRLASTNYIDLQGVGAAGLEREGPGRPLFRSWSCLKAVAMGPLCPTRAHRHEVPWTWGGQAWWSRAVAPTGAQSTEQTFQRLYLRVFIKCGRLKKSVDKMHFLGVGREKL